MALPKFSELLFRINNPGVTINEGKETEQMDEAKDPIKDNVKKAMIKKYGPGKVTFTNVKGFHSANHVDPEGDMSYSHEYHPGTGKISNTPHFTSSYYEEFEQVNEISGEVRGRAAGMRVDREFGQKPPSKSDLRKGNTMADKHKRTQSALAADPRAPGFAKGYMKKEEYSIFESATYKYNDDDVPPKAALTTGYEADDIHYPSVKAHMKNKGVPEDHANAIVAHLKNENENEKGSGYTDSNKKGFDVQSTHGNFVVHSRSNSETGETKFHVSDAKNGVAEGYNPNSVDAENRRGLAAHREKELTKKAADGDKSAEGRLQALKKKKEGMAQAYYDRMER